jgi:hypothetical protein
MLDRLRAAGRAAGGLAIAAAALVLAACGGSAALAERRTLADDSRACDRSRSLVAYSASDGWTFHDRLALGDDGRAVLEHSSHSGPRLALVRREASFTAADDELAGIRAALEESRFATLRSSYLPVREGADLTSYWITHCGKEVYVDGFAIEEGRVPERLLRVIELLDDLVAPEVEKALAR